MRANPTYLAIIGLLIMACISVRAQVEPIRSRAEPDTTSSSQIHEKAENFVYDIENNTKYLNGNVVLWQDSLFMYCDTAIIVDKHVIAYGHVVIIQSDTIRIFGDSLVYDGHHRKGDLYGRVILENGQEELRTDQLHYDAVTKTAHYSTGAYLRNRRTTLYSQRGTYDVGAKLATFYEHVNVQDSSFHLRADSLRFFTELQKAIFIGPTRIDQGESQIYCESGYYDIPAEEALFEVNAQYIKNDIRSTADRMFYRGKAGEVTLIGEARYTERDRFGQADTLIYFEDTEAITMFGNAHYKDDQNEAKSDRIYYEGSTGAFRTVGRSRISDAPMILEALDIDYNKESGIGHARGDVFWQDTTAGFAIQCDDIDFRKKEDFVKAIGYEERPLLLNISEEDTLFLSADTLFSVRHIKDRDTNRFFLAYNDVRIYRHDMQAVCDSLAYFTADSTFYLYDSPMIWSDTTQFAADSIEIQLRNKQIHQVRLKHNGFIISVTPEELYNQIKGTDIVADFDENELAEMFVDGNAESIYYIQDDGKAYIGASNTICSRMKFFFISKKLEDIYYFTKPTSKLTPIQDPQVASLRLTGFSWEPGRRPESVDAITTK